MCREFYVPFTQPLSVLTSCIIIAQYENCVSDVSTIHRAYNDSTSYTCAHLCMCPCVYNSMQVYYMYSFM